MPALHNRHTLRCLVELTPIKFNYMPAKAEYPFFIIQRTINVFATLGTGNFEQVQYGKYMHSDKRPSQCIEVGKLSPKFGPLTKLLCMHS